MKEKNYCVDNIKDMRKKERKKKLEYFWHFSNVLTIDKPANYKDDLFCLLWSRDTWPSPKTKTEIKGIRKKKTF